VTKCINIKSAAKQNPTGTVLETCKYFTKFSGWHREVVCEFQSDNSLSAKSVAIYILNVMRHDATRLKYTSRTFHGANNSPFYNVH